MAKAGRHPNSLRARSTRLALNQATKEYLEGIALTGIHGNNWTDVAKKFIGDGIAQALRDRVIPRRKSEVPYEIDDQSS
jgi:hypothetical protein